MFSEPVIGEKFFGREAVLDLLNKRASALKDGYRQNIALTGQSLAGKSSIIHHFLHTLKDEEFITAYVEVMKEPFGDFANKFIATILYSTLAKMGEQVEPDMAYLLEKAEKFLPKTYTAIKHINSYIEKAQHDEAYSALLALTSMLKGEINMSCIVILDEFDNLEYLGVKNPFINFGKMIMVQKDTMYIVSSSRDEAIKKILSEKLSLLFGNFEIVKIAGFDTKAAGRFIDTKIEAFEMDVDVRRFLIAFTGANPFYLDKMATRAKEIAYARMSNHIDSNIIRETIIDLVYNSNGVIHQYVWNYLLQLLDTKDREFDISILVLIASGRNRQGDITRGMKAKKSDTAKSLAQLAERGVISKNGVFYTIDDTVLGFWLRHVYQRKKELLVDGVLNKLGFFDNEVGGYLADYTRELDKDIILRLEELFNQFSSELVQIESRSMRLPHFTKVDKRSFLDGKSYIAPSFRGKSWIVQPYEYTVGENEIIEFIRNIKGLDLKISNKVIVPLAGMDENAKLLAKELRISIWDLAVINTLLAFYMKKKIILL